MSAPRGPPPRAKAPSTRGGWVAAFFARGVKAKTLATGGGFIAPRAAQDGGSAAREGAKRRLRLPGETTARLALLLKNPARERLRRAEKAVTLRGHPRG